MKNSIYTWWIKQNDTPSEPQGDDFSHERHCARLDGKCLNPKDCDKAWCCQYEAAIRERDERIVMLKGLLLDVRVTLSHAQTFIASREKMHPDGVALYQADIKRIDAALADHSRAGI